MRKISVLLLLVIGVALLSFGGYQWFSQNQMSLEPIVEALPAETTTTTVVQQTTTTTQATPTTVIPPAEGDFGELEPPIAVIDYADPNSLEIPRVDIDATIDNVGPEQYNSCNRRNNPCFGRDMLDAWTDDDGRVGVCELGASFITGHSTSGKGRPDTFTNLIDDPEFSYDEGVKSGDRVIVGLTDGSHCIGEVVDFTDGPGDKLPDSPARFFEKLDLGLWVADALSDVAGSDSVGFLMTSYCGDCGSGDWYKPGDLGDDHWHRRYTAVVMVRWTHESLELTTTGVLER